VSEKQLQAVKNKKRKNKKARDDKRQEQLAHVWKNNCYQQKVGSGKGWKADTRRSQGGCPDGQKLAFG
jgi:hypothetical protein